MRERIPINAKDMVQYTEMAKVSIIIPVYHAADWLRRAIDSVIAQTVADWELVLVDDGSTDGSGAICKAYASDDARIHVIRQTHGGVAKARQAGLDAASAPYVGWVDADDWIEPNHFERLLSEIETTKADMVWGGLVWEEAGRTWRDELVCANDPQALIEEILSCRMMASLCAKLFRREAIVRQAVRFDTSCEMMEDLLFLIEFLLARPTVCRLPAATYHYVRRQGSLTAQPPAENWARGNRADEIIQARLTGQVTAALLHYRRCVRKCWMHRDASVPDALFYAYHPEIRWLPKGVCGWPHRLLFWLSTRHLRPLVRLLLGRH